MGIPGLTTFISNHSEYYFENFTLHDSYLVIDGNSIGCQLFNWYTRYNCAFGGDYDKYAQCVSYFFDELSKCNITPLVLIDGGAEDKKLKTIISRFKDKFQAASHYTPASQHKNNFFPLFRQEIFKNVMTEKGIKFAQCLFEADNTIAAIARILNCPVLSYDSDFFIYGSLYIPFNTWENHVIRNPTGNGYMKRCKIYYVDKLFQVYHGLNQSLLPLAAILLGNDYVKQRTFKNFFRHLKLPPVGRRKYNEQQRRIDATFNWLRRHGLNQAVVGILSRLQKRERKYILDTIETIMNSYINAPLNMLVVLNLPVKMFSKADIRNASKIYKFEGDIYKLTYIEEKSNETNLSDEDETDETEEKEITNMLQKMKIVSDEFLVNNLPEWFVKEFNMGRYPSYFIDLIIRKFYISAPQIEDFSCASSVIASLKIINVIYKILISEIDGNKTNMKYMTRDENKKIKFFELECNDDILNRKLPTLSNLREIPIIIRIEILNSTLGINGDSCINEIPSAWALYIATIKYWIDQQQEPFKFNCHIYSLLFAMLFNIIDNNIGFHRVLNTFQYRFHETMQNILSARKAEQKQPQYLTNTLLDMIQNIDTDDCFLAAPFFITNFEMDSKIYLQPKKFDITIVHGFAEFQQCLKHSMQLNALLEYPYERTKIANVFNGTLLYNLCANFQKRDDVEIYISLILQNSPSLLHLFNMLLSKVKPLFGLTGEKKINKCKKHRTKNEKEEVATQEEEIEEETVKSCDNSDQTFYDANNPFSLLGTL